jgi:hypothetical protein
MVKARRKRDSSLRACPGRLARNEEVGCVLELRWETRTSLGQT